LSSPFGQFADDTLRDLAHELPVPLVQLPITPGHLGGAWSISLWLIAFTWFQPLLLRLDAMRSLAWIVGFFVSPVIAVMANPDGLYGLPRLLPLVGSTAAITSTLLLIGQRSRPWLGLLGGLAYGVGLLLESARTRAPLVGIDVQWLPSLEFSVFRASLASTILVGNLVFALPLIFGTKPIPGATEPS
jgi:hypothetical protein